MDEGMKRERTERTPTPNEQAMYRTFTYALTMAGEIVGTVGGGLLAVNQGSELVNKAKGALKKPESKIQLPPGVEKD